MPSPTPRCSSYWKGSLLVAFDYRRQLYLLLPLNFSFIFISVHSSCHHYNNEEECISKTKIKDKHSMRLEFRFSFAPEMPFYPHQLPYKLSYKSPKSHLPWIPCEWGVPVAYWLIYWTTKSMNPLISPVMG